jgi:hypothetical protein
MVRASSSHGSWLVPRWAPLSLSWCVALGAGMGAGLGAVSSSKGSYEYGSTWPEAIRRARSSGISLHERDDVSAPLFAYTRLHVYIACIHTPTPTTYGQGPGEERTLRRRGRPRSPSRRDTALEGSPVQETRVSAHAPI